MKTYKYQNTSPYIFKIFLLPLKKCNIEKFLSLSLSPSLMLVYTSCLTLAHPCNYFSNYSFHYLFISISISNRNYFVSKQREDCYCKHKSYLSEGDLCSAKCVAHFKINSLTYNITVFEGH